MGALEKQLIWKKYKISGDDILIKIGEKYAHINRHSAGFLFFLDEESSSGASLGANTKYRTFIAPLNSSLEILPALPDKSVVIKPVEDYNILPKESVSFFISIPLYVQGIVKRHNQDIVLFDEPLKRLSLTWFGIPEGEGELAYSVKEGIATRFDDAEKSPEYIVCPVKIFNSSNTILNFNRVILRTQHLNIYVNEEQRLITNEAQVNFTGVEQNSHVRYLSSAPGYVQGLKKIANARTSSDNSILKRSFDYIKSISQYQ